MASEGGRAGVDLSQRLQAEPHRFSFFQAVRLAECAAREWAASEQPFPNGRRRPSGSVGRDCLPEEEAVRFRTLPTLAFPGCEVAKVELPGLSGDGKYPPMDVVVSFLGLIGANGVLPHHYTALLLKQIRHDCFWLRDWLDVFQHRMVSQFYRAWEKYRLPIAFEYFQAEARRQRSALQLEDAGHGAPKPESGDDPVSWGLYCLVGQGTGGLRGRLEVPDTAFLYYAGQFSHQPRNASSLQGLLVDYFGLPAEVRQLQGQWLMLSDDDLAEIGGRGGRNNEPGKTLIVGRRVWDVQSKFRVRVGPLSYAQFCRLMPSGDSLRPICQLARVYVGPELDFDVQPVLKAAEVPKCSLRRQGERSRLGWNTWVHSRPMRRDVDDAVFSLDEL